MKLRNKRRGTRAVQQVQGYYLYEVGTKIHPLADLKADVMTRQDALLPLIIARGALQPLIYNSVFKLKTCVTDGAALLDAINTLYEEWTGEGADRSESLTMWDLYGLQQALSRFETVLSAEFGQIALYVAQKKGNMDTMEMVENGAGHFPEDVAFKAPEAIEDLNQGARCLAFELNTAAGFHFHRANEAVLRRYYDAVTAGAVRPTNASMGLYLSELEKLQAGDEVVRSALRSLTKLHRNPLNHPDHTIETAEEALGLMSQIRAAIGYMLPVMPVVQPPLAAGAA